MHISAEWNECEHCLSRAADNAGIDERRRLGMEWMLVVMQNDDETSPFIINFLLLCRGYYSHFSESQTLRLVRL